MSAYQAVLSARFRVLLQYRAAALAGAGTQLFWGLIRVMIFEGFYRSTTAPQPMRYDEVVTYIWLSQAFFAMTLLGPDTDVRAMVRSGTVAYELLRPLDLYGLWFSRSLAMKAAPTLLRIAPVLLVAGLFFHLQAPASWAAAGAWLISMLAALLLSGALCTLVTISLLWTLSGEGVARLVPAMAYLLCGLVVPIPLLPDWAQGVINFLPFRGLVDTPFRIYMGHMPAEQAWPAILHQLAWTAALVFLGRSLLNRATRGLAIQGG